MTTTAGSWPCSPTSTPDLPTSRVPRPRVPAGTLRVARGYGPGCLRWLFGGAIVSSLSGVAMSRKTGRPSYALNRTLDRWRRRVFGVALIVAVVAAAAMAAWSATSSAGPTRGPGRWMRSGPRTAAGTWTQIKELTATARESRTALDPCGRVRRRARRRRAGDAAKVGRVAGRGRTGGAEARRPTVRAHRHQRGPRRVPLGGQRVRARGRPVRRGPAGGAGAAAGPARTRRGRPGRTPRPRGRWRPPNWTRSTSTPGSGTSTCTSRRARRGRPHRRPQPRGHRRLTNL